MKSVLLIILLLTLVSCGRGPELQLQGNRQEARLDEAQYQRELDEIKKSLKGEAKVKLKRDAKGGYSWDISGKDAHEIIKINEVLRKKFSE